MKPNNYSLIEQFPPQDDKMLFDLLQFIKKAPFQKDYWHIFKRVYKLTEDGLSKSSSSEKTRGFLINIMSKLLSRLDKARKQDINSEFPTIKTLLYMKRRARRFLKNLGKTNKSEYFTIASRVLVSNHELEHLDHSNQWISLDILFGNSKRVFQKLGGSGSYVVEVQKYNLKHREERFFKIWDEHIDFARELINQKMPWEVKAFAVKLLIHNNVALPEIGEDTLSQFFASPSIWLKRVATNFCFQVYNIQGLKPSLYAGMWFYASATKRKKIEEIDNKRPKKDNAWYHKFSVMLSDLAISELRQKNASNRVINALIFLKDNYPKLVPNGNLTDIAPVLLQSKAKILRDLAIQSYKSATKEDAFVWMAALGNTRTDYYDRLFKLLESHFNGMFSRHNVDNKLITKFTFHESPYVCDFGWMLAIRTLDFWSVYNFWNKLVAFNETKTIKEVFFLNAITSTYGIKSFCKTFGRYNYLNNLSGYSIQYIFEHGLEKIKGFVYDKAKEIFKASPIYLFDFLEKLPENIADQIFDEVKDSFKREKFFEYTWETRSLFLTIQKKEFIYPKILSLILNSKHSQQGISNMLDVLFMNLDKEYITYFLEAFEQWDNLNYKQWCFEALKTESILLENAQYIPQSFLKSIVEQVSFKTILNLVENLSIENWDVFSELIKCRLVEEGKKQGAWKLILERVINSNSQNLHTRILETPEFFALFLTQRDITILDINEPNYETLLVDWANHNKTFFAMGSHELFKLCIHKMPALREVGLSLCEELGLTIPFALRLLESNLPDPMEVAKTFFNNIIINSTQEIEAVLALCDSPQKATRAFGLAFFKSRKDNFKDSTKVLECLAEHSDVYVQKFVAEEFFYKKINTDISQKFNKEVLRRKNEARGAKEVVKKSVNLHLALDTEALLELVQSNTRKDAEWAMEVLVKKALMGENIKGFELI